MENTGTGSAFVGWNVERMMITEEMSLNLVMILGHGDITEITVGLTEMNLIDNRFPEIHLSVKMGLQQEQYLS